MRMFYNAGNNCTIQENAIVGFQYKKDCKKTVLGENNIIRAFSIIYADVTTGDNVKTGHHVLIRENTKLGNRIIIGSGSILDGNINIGNEVKIESQVYIPTHTIIGNKVFIGPGVTFTNDRYPLRLRDQYQPQGAIIEDGVTIGAQVVVLPGVKIGEGSFIAAGAVVTKDVPPWSLVKGNPGTILPLPKKLKELNNALNW